MKARRVIRRMGIAIAVICVLVTVLVLRHPPDPFIYCQKSISAALDQWMLEEKTNVYPNVNGNGEESLRILDDFMGYGDIVFDYGYVPGLKDDDPDDLVFMYLKKKTRRTWNGDNSPSIFSPKKWMVLPPAIWHKDVFNRKSDYIPDPESYSHRYGEGGLLVDTPELKRRVEMTLEFLKENNRPHWENVVKEHTEFLNSIKE